MLVIVKRSTVHLGLPVITVRAPTDPTLQNLEILLQQWLARPEDDKLTMQHATALPQTRTNLLRALKLKFRTFLKRKIHEDCTHALAIIEKVRYKIGFRVQRNYNKKKVLQMLESLNDVKLKCVVATYKYFINSDSDILSSFCTFFRLIETLPDQTILPELMITAVWYCFELFTPHLSPAISNAMKLWQQNGHSLFAAGEKHYEEKYRSTYEDVIKSSAGGPELVSKSLQPTALPRRMEGENLGQIGDGEGSADKSEATECLEEERLRKEAMKNRKKDLKTKKLMKVERRLRANARLGLPPDAPVCGDRRNFTHEQIKRFVGMAHDVVKEHSLHGRKLERAIMKNGDGSNANSNSVIYLWNEIRQMIRRRDSDRH